MYFEYFLLIHQVGAKWTAENNILLRFTSLDINFRYDHFIMLTLKNPHTPIFIRF